MSFPFASKALEPKVTLGLSGPRGCLRACFPGVVVLFFFGGGKGARIKGIHFQTDQVQSLDRFFYVRGQLPERKLMWHKF